MTLWFLVAIPPSLQRAFTAFQAGDLVRAAAEASEALREAPDHADVHYLLGMIHFRAGALEQAEPWLRRAVNASPANGERAVNLGKLLFALRRFAEAEELARSFVRQNPGSLLAHRLLGDVLYKRGDDDGALAAFQQVIRLIPGGADATVVANIGSILNMRGEHTAARETLDRALAGNPHDPLVAGATAYAANAWSDLSPQELFARHQEVGRRIARVPQMTLPPLANTPEPGRRLRIAYMTPDARQHSASYFLEALFAYHDREGFDVGLYCNAKRTADEKTAGFASRSDRYVVLTGLTERQAAQKLVDDGTDVLVDLAGYTTGSGVWLLRSRVAPVQINYLGYPNTTAMPCADVRIVDAVTDPPGAEVVATERLVRIDPCFLCYTPPDNPPAPGRDAGEGPFTFGSFNALHKHSPATLDLLAAALKAVPGSRLMVKAKTLASEEAKRLFTAALVSRGIDASRLVLRSFVEEVGDHLALYRQIDVALDTTPYNGTTTTCEALLMGVPVVTLCGDRHAARVSTSLLSAVGGPHAQLIARSPEELEGLARSLADPQSSLAGSLSDRAVNRRRFLESPVCDGPRFVRALESVYRTEWQGWCGERTKGKPGA